jgi:ABC-type bacteriocin/lantibiotic exporter with double-glycine peptidase domain
LSYPVLIYFDIDYINNGQENLSQGIMLFILTTLGFLLFNIVNTYRLYLINYFGVHLSSTINLVIFNKALKFPTLSNRQFTEADIINYSQIDAENLNQIGSKFIFFIFGLVEIIVELIILYIFVGLLFLIPLGIMTITTIVSFTIGNTIIDYNMTALEKKDDRINATE